MSSRDVKENLALMNLSVSVNDGNAVVQIKDATVKEKFTVSFPSNYYDDIELITSKEWMLSDFISNFGELHARLAHDLVYQESTAKYLSAVAFKIQIHAPIYVGDIFKIDEIGYEVSKFLGLEEQDYHAVTDVEKGIKNLLVTDDEAVRYVAYFGFKGMINDMGIEPITEAEIASIIDRNNALFGKTS
jgi:hypothetical protein